MEILRRVVCGLGYEYEREHKRGITGGIVILRSSNKDVTG
jgi:hypothetical protein